MLTVASERVVGPGALAGFEGHADDGRTAVVERAGHFLPEERPDAVLAALGDHLRAARPRG